MDPLMHPLMHPPVRPSMHPPMHPSAKRRPASPVLLAVLVSLGLPTAAAAQPAPATSSPVAAPAPELLSACQACHGRDGVSDTASVPNLAGQKRDYLVRQLEAFKQGTRKNDLMSAVAAQLDGPQMLQLAQHWSRQPAAPAAPASAVALRSRMTFPAGFPQGFHLYQTLVEGEQVTRRWANAPAWQAAAAGQPLPDGSSVVVTSHGPDRMQGGKAVPGPVQSYAAMSSRSGWGDALPPLLRNGDWDYALFSADGQRRDSLNQASCLACHRPLADRSFVFTLEALRTASRAAR